MLARVSGFNWDIYTDTIMPAFTRWLVHDDAKMIGQLYERTRCASEELYMPAIMQHLRTWPRAQTFVQQLPQGSYTRDEYELLCDPESFTAMSDIYVHRHPPRLYRESNAIRVIWGALLEHYCLSWFTLSDSDDESAIFEEKEASLMTNGAVLGHHPATVHLRGWLATISVRATALFEFLACGRRCLPFGYRLGEPYEDSIGYLTPLEVLRLATCLRSTEAPDSLHAERDYARFRLIQDR
ncbi:MAG: hypothetical protein H0U76_24530, partial [Ktedonobacteraceae bacterium]|nr:hypothetical protein [Ktedonobacteraceae bacterium]